MSKHEERLISMTYWYPIIQAIGMRVPETVFVHYPYGLREVYRLIDGETPKNWQHFLNAIDSAAQEFGYPVFLRTEQTSDKHSWKDTCYLASKDDVPLHVFGLIEHSLMADRPCDFFAVRKLIETEPVCTTFRGEMPVAKERRVFAKDGSVICNHPYWPHDAFVGYDGRLNDNVSEQQITDLQAISDEDLKETNAMAAYVSKYIPDAWSIDFLQDKKGLWWLIDMALAENSYHWPQCENRGLQVDVNLITGERTHKTPESEQSK